MSERSYHGATSRSSHRMTQNDYTIPGKDGVGDGVVAGGVIAGGVVAGGVVWGGVVNAGVVGPSEIQVSNDGDAKLSDSLNKPMYEMLLLLLLLLL